jgi:DNA-binding response OmpR family regulator
MLQRVLQQADYEVSAYTDGPEVIRAVQLHGLPSLFILDYGLPTTDGFTLADRLKKMGDVPIIFLTGNTSKQNTVNALEKYAEDYITKPFDVKEVVARISRILSRSINTATNGAVIEIDNRLSIDFPNNKIIRDGSPYVLTPIETAILHILYTNRGRTISPQTLLTRVWSNEEVYEDTLRVHMSRLRTKLQGEIKEPQYIMTERGSGYTFFMPSTSIPSTSS